MAQQAQLNKINKFVNAKSGAQRFGVREERILDEDGQPIRGSNVRRSLHHLIRERAGARTAKREPPGTRVLESRLKKDTILYSWTKPIVTKGLKKKQKQRGGGAFLPSKWSS